MLQDLSLILPESEVCVESLPYWLFLLPQLETGTLTVCVYPSSQGKSVPQIWWLLCEISHNILLAPPREVPVVLQARLLCPFSVKLTIGVEASPKGTYVSSHAEYLVCPARPWAPGLLQASQGVLSALLTGKGPMSYHQHTIFTFHSCLPLWKPESPSPRRQRMTHRPLHELERKLTCSQGQLSLPDPD